MPPETFSGGTSSRVDFLSSLFSGSFTLPNQFSRGHNRLCPHSGQLSEQFVTTSQLRQKKASSNFIAEGISTGILSLPFSSSKFAQENLKKLGGKNFLMISINEKLFPVCGSNNLGSYSNKFFFFFPEAISFSSNK